MSQKRTTSQMNGTSEQTGDNPLKRVKAMLEENEKKVAFSKNETEEFGDLILQNKKAIEFYEYQIKDWESNIRRDKQYIQGLQQTNREYEEDIRKNRLEVLELKHEEEALKVIKKQGETREKRLNEAVNRILTKFLEPALEKVVMSPEKEINGDEKVAVGGDGKKTTSEVDNVTTGEEDIKKTEGDEEKNIKKETRIHKLQRKEVPSLYLASMRAEL
ncbi:4ad94911-710b-43bf-83ec-15ddf4c7a5fd [Sclerotinia trifoliorum]|uniref:4ad94911-710b-43bf-83ec-15ddf4c7a5fd n=1 Tax=Sclerotinia trifoliorum TaxID=28548 RepID=A0A8H2ZS55_9HELO|nr:4ad94911-710b-43bf-83ec-15ddf4c7a5fd [Sclerotinia trifoliorum]